MEVRRPIPTAVLMSQHIDQLVGPFSAFLLAFNTDVSSHVRVSLWHDCQNSLYPEGPASLQAAHTMCASAVHYVRTATCEEFRLNQMRVSVQCQDRGGRVHSVLGRTRQDSATGDGCLSKRYGTSRRLQRTTLCSEGFDCVCMSAGYCNEVAQHFQSVIVASHVWIPPGSSLCIAATHSVKQERRRKDEALQATIMQKLIETGERERLKDLLRERLIQCGWRDELKVQRKQESCKLSSKQLNCSSLSRTSI